MLVERGVEVDHVTVYQWVQRFTPLFADAARFARHSHGDRPGDADPLTPRGGLNAVEVLAAEVHVPAGWHDHHETPPLWRLCRRSVRAYALDGLSHVA